MRPGSRPETTVRVAGPRPPPGHGQGRSPADPRGQAQATLPSGGRPQVSVDAGTGRGPGHCPLSVGRQLLPISFPSGLLLRLQNIPERGRGPGPLSPGQLRLGPGSQERRSQPAQRVTGQPLSVTRQAGVQGWEEVPGAAAPPEGAPGGRCPHVHHGVPATGPAGSHAP